ncbi:tyrosine-type recombinase/integrase [Persephonella sp. KM09-Lau-8]|uniref:tyrosine-type recombinase/integrase n=1 Tax=Persephonella sp. KM09-Lau-8 TaxID=1158345 RepID=UPI000496DCF8|nr:tyrosine-type recombinase/integrase [Persephonella sp. KM09-Lau-8]
MVKLSYKGNFLVHSEHKKLLEKHFKEFLSGERGYFVLPGTTKIFNKILFLFDEKDIDPSCYLFPIIASENISGKTKQLYFQINKNFLDFVRKKPQEVRPKDIQAYLNYLRNENKKPSTIKTSYMALRLFYEKLLNVVDFTEIHIPQLNENIPEILTRKEIKKLISSIKNPRHRLIIGFGYCCGMKLNEILSLKVNDIDLNEGIINIRGKHSRKIPVPQTILQELQMFLTQESPKEFLFQSRDTKSPISHRSVEIMFKNSLRKAGLPSRYTFSILRDTFVVHMIEKGVCLNHISDVLGVKKSHLQQRYSFYIENMKFYKIPDMFDFSDVA